MLARSDGGDQDVAGAGGATAVGLRERKRERTRVEIASAALRLFADRGFDATTIESIALAADVSPRTFFRYFAAKDDVLFDDASQRTGLVIAALRAHPGGVAPVRMLCDALAVLKSSWESDLPSLMLRHRVVAETPSVQSRAWGRRHGWEATLVDQLAERFGTSPDVLLGLQVTVAATTAALYVAFDAWVASGGRRSLTQLVDSAWQVLVEGFEQPRAVRDAAKGKRR
jgi:AcrR family transcriptional regulator